MMTFQQDLKLQQTRDPEVVERILNTVLYEKLTGMQVKDMGQERVIRWVN